MTPSAADLLARTPAALRRRVAAVREAGTPLVLVPTMGDLHDGHLSLVREAAHHGAVVVSVFVNPTQFSPGEDFEAYPRDLDRDLARLAAESSVVAVFAPEVETMYPPGDDTRVCGGRLTRSLCGAHRPGHFDGVCTVVAKLFGLVRPDVAVFGQKDAQQCLVLERMVRDLALGVELVFAPTVREPDGLAMSSRNRYLDDTQRIDALRISRALAAGRERLVAGERRAERVEAAMRAELGDLRVDYAEARSLPDLEHPDLVAPRVLLAVAAHVGRARLIDNLSLALDDDSVTEIPLGGRPPKGS